MNNLKKYTLNLKGFNGVTTFVGLSLHEHQTCPPVVFHDEKVFLLERFDSAAANHGGGQPVLFNEVLYINLPDYACYVRGDQDALKEVDCVRISIYLNKGGNYIGKLHGRLWMPTPDTFPRVLIYDKKVYRYLYLSRTKTTPEHFYNECKYLLVNNGLKPQEKQLELPQVS